MNNIEKMLDKHNIRCHPTYNCYGETDLNLTYQLKSYRIIKDGNLYKIFEANMALNPRRKERHHCVMKSKTAEEIVNYIVTRKFYKKAS